MKYSNKVSTWLFIGLVMVFIQVIVGGITRLTESGLSITKWEVVEGTLPPLTENEWEVEFGLYKATPQYQEINEGMTLSDFKFIYFWEYIHRFWARFMGFVFLIPFIWFYLKGYFDKNILKKIGWVVLLAILAATFGWIMVASGLIERPWVNAYKLSLHLCIAFGVYCALLWTYLTAKNIEFVSLADKKGSFYKILYLFLFLLIGQIFLGGIMSGMKAAVIYPSWPDLNGSYVPAILLNIEEWNFDNFNNYDRSNFMPALIHFLHRNTAYLLFILGILLSYKMYKLSQNTVLKYSAIFLFVILWTQVTLGVLTLVNSVGYVPVFFGVMHQAFALLLLSVIVYVIFILRLVK